MTLSGEAVLDASLPMAGAAADDLEAIVREHAGLVYQVAYAVLRNHHDAEDAAQETFTRVLRYRRRLGRVRDLRAWLARIAWRTALSRRARLAALSLEEVGTAVQSLRAADATADEIAASREMRDLLGRLIASLPRELSQTLALSLVEELSSAEIAQVLDIPPASVRTRLYRARQLLRQKLAAVLEGKHGR